MSRKCGHVADLHGLRLVHVLEHDGLRGDRAVVEALALVAVPAGAHLEVEGAVHAVLLGPEDPGQVLRHSCA